MDAVARVLESVARDVRAAGRTLAARPGWTVAAILCLAIATGANTAAFSILNGLLLRPLPFDDPDQLVVVALREPTRSADFQPTMSFSRSVFSASRRDPAPDFPVIACQRNGGIRSCWYACCLNA